VHACKLFLTTQPAKQDLSLDNRSPLCVAVRHQALYEVDAVYSYWSFTKQCNWLKYDGENLDHEALSKIRTKNKVNAFQPLTNNR
jgi:hypothetical protein